ncbi:MAG: DegV family EDD domain-containing protein [Lachnospiraceae bacterium]|nr:DegV family EDD domain-containing protein [Lachnospiraceae bacterium]
MNIRRLIRDISGAIRDPEREISERLFLSLSMMSELVVLIAFIGDIITKENKGELIVLTVTLIFVPAVTLICLYRNKLKLAIRIIVAGLVFVILPALFFLGGGMEGGGVLWFIFAFMYVGLVISGKWRIALYSVFIILTIACYSVQYFHPEWIAPHSRGMFCVDSCISIILVGFLCFIMTWLQTRFFLEENERAKKEAERAEELTRSQNRFFSSMSHEIRTPINSILGLNELILRDQSTSDEVVKDASGIQGAGKLLLALINDILDFSKIEAGSMDIVPVDYRVGDMLSEIVNMIWLKADDKGLELRVSIDPKLPSVLYGDEIRIKQIIINLLNNAVKYTAEGFVELRLERLEENDDKVSLSIAISDSGMGIKKEALPNLFDAFKRVDEEKNRYIEGTGLGLSIVKQLVELMNGTITVNSVYGEGSTFLVVVKQGISDHTRIGELNIHNQQTRRNVYESSFQAAEARILIVDDNEMNLEVESRLLEGTEMMIDKALSGRAALELTVKNHYDVILMDHLMPEMDGIECLEALRSQAGGMNRTTPVVVLTANAGGDNRELYAGAGFDGYLVKPVSGEALEGTLIRFIPEEKLILSGRLMNTGEDIHAADRYYGKVPVIVTTTTMSDLPDAIVKKLNIPIIPFRIRTEEGTFKDGVQVCADELIRYITAGKSAVSFPPDEAEYTEFFSGVLKRAHHLIHIALTTSMSEDYRMACEAAKSFDNVTVINSGCLSSATGILVLIAHKLAQQNIPVQDIVSELETVKQRLKCSFVIDTTDYMARKGLISHRVHALAKALNLHPSLTFREDRSGIRGIWLGNTRRAYRNYIKKAFPVDTIPDSDVVFVTYVDIPTDTLLWIKEEISKAAYFENVIFKQASAAISSNCGPGTFGILYFVKSNKSYNLGSYIEKRTEDERANEENLSREAVRREETGDIEDEEAARITDEGEEPFREAEEADSGEAKWYQNIDGIDGEAAITNSGSEEAFRTVLKIFYDSIPDKASEIDGYYTSEDWENYTIKVHALKSSSKLVGALELSDEAAGLEQAGKDKDTEYIAAHHSSMLQDFLKYRERLSAFFDGDEKEEDKPMADEYLLQSVYEELQNASASEDGDTIAEILNEIGEYALPEEDAERLDIVREKAESGDYAGIKGMLGG